MTERVRIYELARKMNLDNQVLIDAFRELGYDIKSHSSTVDGNAVGRVIAHLGKRKQAATAPKPQTKLAKPAAIKGTPSTGTVVQATVAAPTPTAPVVKPRVLARYRPTPAPGTPGAEGTPGAPTLTSIPVITPPAPIQEPAPPAEPEVQPPVDEAPPEAATPTKETTTPAAAESTQAQEPVAEVKEHEPVTEPEPQSNFEPEKAGNTKDLQPKETKPKDDSPEAQLKNVFSGSRPTAPSQPSQPIRIAAPSFRATPPRAPKSRHQPSERHGAKREERSRPAAVTVEIPKVITLTGSLTVKELSERMIVSETEVIKRLFVKGYMRTVNQLVELELATELAAEMGYELTSAEDIAIAAAIAEEEAKPIQAILTEEEISAQVIRPPVVTIMGHVDHGKTSLLDAIRQTKFLLTDAEHGGITQHIGAYHVEVTAEDGTPRQIVFLDTPGHEAFTAMRARGAKATDIAILVVAADDGVMPQTREAIDHAKAAGVPIIVAINKIDLPGADPDRVMTDLMQHNVVPDKYGGDTVTVNVSAKKRTGLDELLEMILLVADIQDLKASPERPAVGFIIESELSRGKGAVATALVQNGTLREGDYIVAGTVSGRVRALFDDRGERVKAAGPSMPVEVLGLGEVPAAGDRFEVCPDMAAVKALVEQRKEAEAEKVKHRVTLESLHDLMETGEVKELKIIVKADVLGTAEAIADQISKITTKEVQVRVLRAATGDISENDVNLAASSNAIVIGFNVQPDNNATRAAETSVVDIRTYNIIYKIIDDLTLAAQGLLQPILQEQEIGAAEVRALFKLGKNLVIAGCMVTEGKIQRNCIARVFRGKDKIYEGKIDTLKRFKDDAKEVAAGYECGISLEKWNDQQEGDIIRAFVINEIKRELTR